MVYLSLQVIKWSHRRSETVGFEAIDLPDCKALIAGDKVISQHKLNQACWFEGNTTHSLPSLDATQLITE